MIFIHQSHSIPSGLAGNAANLGSQSLEFDVKVAHLRWRVGAVGSLNCKFTHTLKHIGLLNHCAVCCLNHIDSVVEVTDRHVETANDGSHILANGQTSGVVLGRVNAGAG